MITRRGLQWLVSAMATLVAAIGVLLGFRTLFASLGDPTTARILGGFALACLVILLVDVLLLVGGLGLAVSQLLPETPSQTTQNDTSPSSTAGLHENADSIQV